MSVVMSLLTFEECLKDSPAFRKTLGKAEDHLSILQDRYHDVTHTCHKSVEYGREFSARLHAFHRSLDSLTKCYEDNDRVKDSLQKMVKIYTEFQELFCVLLEKMRSAEMGFGQFLERFKTINNTKKAFERSSDTLDGTLQKAAAVSRHKPQEHDEMDKVVSIQRDSFFMTSLDYVHQLRSIQLQKNAHVLETLMSLLDAHKGYYSDGLTYLKDVNPWIKHIETQISFVKEQSSVEEKRMDNRHAIYKPPKSKRNSLSPSKSPPPRPERPPSFSSATRIEGYLFRRSAKKTWRTWIRKWFVIENNQMLYCKRSDKDFSILEKDLRICTAKPVDTIDRRFCFEVIAPGRSHILQADSEVEVTQWIAALQAGMSQITSGRNSIPSVTRDGDGSARNMTCKTKEMAQEYDKKRMQCGARILGLPGNDICADCGAERPSWTSCNLGITVCVACSGMHRSFGVQISKVRSLTLDNWEPEILRVMLSLGNRTINSIYEGNTAALNDAQNTGLMRPDKDSSNEVRRAWLRAKWLDKRFVAAVDPDELCTVQPSSLNGSDEMIETASMSSVDQEGILTSPVLASEVAELSGVGEENRINPRRLLLLAAESRSVPLMAEALALGANVNATEEFDETGTTPLMQAVLGGSLAAVQFLLLNGAKIDDMDVLGRTALHYACEKQRTQQVCLLLKKKAKYMLMDGQGRTPLDVALETRNADIVTMLRLQMLNDQMGHDEDPVDDPMVNAVFDDFTIRAYDEEDDVEGGGPAQTSATSANGPSASGDTNSSGQESINHESELTSL